MTVRPTGENMAENAGSWWSKDTVAVVTGANRGIGYEIVSSLAEHGLTVVLTGRVAKNGEAAIDSLKAKGLQSVVFHPLDVCSSDSVQKLATWLKKEFGGIDILVNNAGIEGDSFCFEAAKEVVEINYYGAKKVTEGLLPLLRPSAAGARIVNVTSRRGLYERLPGDELKQKFREEQNYTEEFVDSMATTYLEDFKAGGANDAGWPWVEASKAGMYSESKIFLNVYAMVLAKRLAKLQPEDHQIFVVSFCPGLTKTDMFVRVLAAGRTPPEGYPVKTAAEGADNGVWLALMAKEELIDKTGKLFGERKEYSFGWDPPF